MDVELSTPSTEAKVLEVTICFGTSCYLRGAQELYKQVVQHLKDTNMENQTHLKASFCNERCKRGPVITINGNTIEHCSPEMAIQEMNKYIS